MCVWQLSAAAEKNSGLIVIRVTYMYWMPRDHPKQWDALS